MIDLKDLIKAGVHFGHQSSRWSPRMAPFIWGTRNNIHLIDISKTAIQLEKSANFLESVAAQGKSILWIGTKKSAQSIVQEAATSCAMPYVTHRWIGGTLTNHTQVRKSVTKYLHHKDIVAKTDSYYTKKENNVFSKIVDRLHKNIGGIVKMTWPIGAIVVVDVKKELSVIKEAATMNIPVVALVDTNSDPLLVDYVIPANDDSPRSIKILIDYLAQSVQKGVAVAKQNKLDNPSYDSIVGQVDKAEKDFALSLLEAEEAKDGVLKPGAIKPSVVKRDASTPDRNTMQKRTFSNNKKPNFANKKPAVKK